LRWILQESEDFTWRLSDCEELVGGQPQEIVSVPFNFTNSTNLAHF